MNPELPSPRGPLTTCLFEVLRAPVSASDAPPGGESADPLADDDLQLALYVLYELHYRGFAGVDADWEWDPSLLALRAGLERSFEAAVRAVAGPVDPVPGDVPDRLTDLLHDYNGPPLGRYLETQGTIEQFREVVVHRSAYQLKEADPHSWAIARLTGRAKVTLVEIQSDEYGGGRPERQHAVLFANTMDALGLESAYGAYLDVIPGATLATVNLMSLFGLHRRLRGAIVGHLALLEMDSSQPSRRYANALRRLGYGPEATDFYDEHVEADAVHEALAAHDMAGALAVDEPALAPDILFGAQALRALDERSAQPVYDAFMAGVSSLRSPLAVPA